MLMLHQPTPRTGEVDQDSCGNCGCCARCRRARANTRARHVLRRFRSALRRYLAQPSFWLGISLSFPIEHFLWEKVWPFDLLTKLLGL